MSRCDDYVKFKLFARAEHSGTLASAFVQAFGQEMPKRCRSEEVTIRCRLDQFARFLIIRNNLGGANSFKELEAEICQSTEDVVVDVRGNVTP